MNIIYWILEKLWHLVLAVFFSIYGSIVIIIGTIVILSVLIRYHIEQTFLLIFRR